MDIADLVIRNYCLEGTHFPVSMLINQCTFHLLSKHSSIVDKDAGVYFQGALQEPKAVWSL